MEAATSYVNDVDVDNLKATELRLGLPGTVDEVEPSKTAVQPTPSPMSSKGNKRAFAEEDSSEEGAKNCGDDDAAPAAAKAQVVGWPPVRAYRKSCFQGSKSKAQEEAKAAKTSGTTNLYVKVSMDGAPYLRKIDLRMYKGYRELREALEDMFMCFSVLDGSNNNGANPSEFAITYEDKDGDLMLVGDVPFEMFTNTCKRLRIMKGSEATGLGSPRQ